MAESAGYRIFRSLARFLAGFFYRRVEEAGIERVPLSGPIVVAASRHQELLRLVAEPVLEKTAR